MYVFYRLLQYQLHADPIFHSRVLYFVQYMLRFAYPCEAPDDFTLQKGPWGPLLPVCDRHSFYLIFFTGSTGRYRSMHCKVDTYVLVSILNARYRTKSCNIHSTENRPNSSHPLFFSCPPCGASLTRKYSADGTP